jgi:hypothetical protein
VGKAFQCDFCHQYRDGEPEKVPETWKLAPSVHVERPAFGLNLQFEVEIKSLAAEVCGSCTRSLAIDGLRQLIAIYEAEV